LLLLYKIEIKYIDVFFCISIHLDISIDPQRITIGENYIRFINVTRSDSHVLQCNASNKHGYIHTNVAFNVLGRLSDNYIKRRSACKTSEVHNLQNVQETLKTNVFLYIRSFNHMTSLLRMGSLIIS